MAVTAKYLRFNNGVAASDGLSWSFARNASTVNPDGSTVNADVPRFASRRLICGAPNPVSTVANTTSLSSVDILATGYDADGITPVWVIYNSDNGQIRIYKGTFPTNWSSGVDGTDWYQYDTSPNAGKGNLPDFLRNSVDVLSTQAWTPISAVVVHGFIALMCSVANTVVSDGGGWHRCAVGIATCNTANLSGAKNTWWRIHSLSNKTTTNTTNSTMLFGASWCMPSWYQLDRDGTDPVKVWIAFTDYQNHPDAFGGVAAVFPVVRSSPTATDWVADATYELKRRNSASSIAHWHTAGLIRVSTLGIRATMVSGDGQGNNFSYSMDLASEGSATATNTLYRSGASLVANGTNWYSGGTPWGTAALVHGTDVYPVVSDKRIGNQSVGMAPGPTAGSLLAGTDESNSTIFKFTPPAAAPQAYENMWNVGEVHSVLNGTGAGYGYSARNCIFHIRKEQPSKLYGKYVAQVAPSQFDHIQRAKNRIIYSPDGINWGIAFWHGEGTVCPPWITNNTIYMGSKGNNFLQGVRSIPVPSYTIAQPILLSPGITNYAAVNGTAALTVAGAALDNPANMTGINPPPCKGRIWHFRGDGVSGANMGYFTVADSTYGTVPNTNFMTVRMWIRCTPPTQWASPAPTNTGSMGSVIVQIQIADNAGAGGVTSTAPRTFSVPTSGEWIPISITLDPKMFATAAAPWRVRTYWITANGTACPLDLRIALDSVVVGQTLPWPVASATTSPPSEVAEASGFNLSGDWSLFTSGLVPFDASWDSTKANVYNASATSVTDTGSATTAVLGATGSTVDNFYVGCRVYVGTTASSVNNIVANSTTKGLMCTAYVGATKVITFQRQTGTPVTGTRDLSIERPQSTAAAVTSDASYLPAVVGEVDYRPLISISNSARTQGFTVFADTVLNRIFCRYWNGTTYAPATTGITEASISNIQWDTGNPVHIGLTHNTTTNVTTLHASVGGTEIASATLGAINLTAAMDKVTFGSISATPVVTPMEWFGVETRDMVASAADVAATLRGLTHTISPLGLTKAFRNSISRLR